MKKQLIESLLNEAGLKDLLIKDEATDGYFETILEYLNDNIKNIERV